MATKKELRRTRIKKSIRRKLSGVSSRPRLSVFRSNRAIYAQIIDDVLGKTLVSASSKELGKSTYNSETSKSVGEKLAEKAGEKGIESVVFDRGGYLYHGNIKALAEGARAKGLKF
jgi:large subunit ribosomal protein L18